MKFSFKKIYIVLILLILLLIESKAFAKDNNISYTSKNISNYFSGIISVNQDYTNEAFRYLKKVQSLKNKHSRFNIEFIRTLVMLGDFEQAFAFSKKYGKRKHPFSKQIFYWD